MSNQTFKPMMMCKGCRHIERRCSKKNLLDIYAIIYLAYIQMKRRFVQKEKEK
jgi:hypothetical protein